MTAKFAFDFPTATLHDILLDRFLKRTAQWFLSGNGTLHALYGNSHWEAALCIDFMAGLLKYLDVTDELYHLIERGKRGALKWLLEEREVTKEGLVHWDGVTWDTAVVLRSLFLVPHAKGTYSREKEHNDVKEIATRALAWLFKRFYEWEKQVKYPFGDSDVAQILLAATYIRTHHLGIFTEALAHCHRLLGYYGERDRILTDIAQYLISRATTFSNEEYTCFWEDFFQTAEVLESLVVYYQAVCKGAITIPEGAINMSDLRDMVFKALHTFEIGQSRGMWGTHADTCRALYSYIKCSKLMELEPEPQIVFKALRWLCDEKQTFQDGSFLHTSFITVFYAHALLQVFENWSYSRKRIIELYDDVLWHMQASSSTERSTRLYLEKTCRDLNERIEHLSMRIRFLKRVIWSIGWSCLIAIGAFLYGHIRQTNMTDVSFLTLFTTLYVTVLLVIWTYERRSDRKKED